MKYCVKDGFIYMEDQTETIAAIQGDIKELKFSLKLLQDKISPHDIVVNEILDFYDSKQFFKLPILS